MHSPPVVIVDDDPTGAQIVQDTAVVVDWLPDVLEELSHSHPPAFHVLTNTRAYDPQRAYATTFEAASAVLGRFPDAKLVLRGDSTLRGHLLEEYEAICNATNTEGKPVLLLVPALPSAGRVTIGGTHFLERDGRRVPLHETEYAADSDFAYRDAHLLRWADERSGGFFKAGEGVEVPLDRLRQLGGDAVMQALRFASAKRRAVACVPDVETLGDAEIVAAGLRSAERAGIPVIVRCAPTFAAVLCGSMASGSVPMPRARRILVVCGSYVPQSTRQLEQLREARPGSIVDFDVSQFLAGDREQLLDDVVSEAQVLLEREGVAIVATPRERSPDARSSQVGELVARGLAETVRRLRASVDLHVFKGGVTSSVCLREGLGARLVRVEGPVGEGVALWRVNRKPCLIFPGNVGRDRALAELVERALHR